MNNNLPFPIVKTEGTPFERGEQYGSQCREMIARVVDFYRSIFEIKSKLSWEQSLAKAVEFVPVLNDYDRGIMEEIEGIASGAQRPVEEITALNVQLWRPFPRPPSMPCWPRIGTGIPRCASAA